MALLREVESFLRASGMTPTAFGRAAVNDAHLVRDLRRGRSTGTRMDARLRAFMAGEKGR